VPKRALSLNRIEAHIDPIGQIALSETCASIGMQSRTFQHRIPRRRPFECLEYLEKSLECNVQQAGTSGNSDKNMPDQIGETSPRSDSLGARFADACLRTL
jgi:hypothetical protein